MKRSSNRARYLAANVTGASCLLVLGVCLIRALIAARRWPLVGDAALIDYAVLLLHAGRMPYSGVVDINQPGSYFLQLIASSLFGPNAHGLRVYDGFLCFAACAMMVVLSRDTARARLFAASGGMLLTLIHLDDGLAQAGQRDLAFAVLALSGAALLWRLSPARPLLALCLFEFFIGSTATVKPTLVVAAFFPFFLGSRAACSRLTPKNIALGSLTFLLPLAMAAGWLELRHSLSSYLWVMETAGRIHAELGRRTLGYLLSHCTSPITILLLPWVAALALVRPQPTARRWLLVAFTAAGLLSYITQGKGLPYHRYPLLAFLLLLISSDMDEALDSGRGLVPALFEMALVGLWFGPSLSVDVTKFSASAPFEEALSTDLRQVDVSEGVQCIDTFGGCINTLYDLRIIQSTGFLYDCYLFSGPARERDTYRADFLKSIMDAKPKYVVLTDQYCFSGPRFDKVKLWPQLNSILMTDYRLTRRWSSAVPEHWWHRREFPSSYEILERKLTVFGLHGSLVQ